jgi:hypothetical protein
VLDIRALNADFRQPVRKCLVESGSLAVFFASAFWRYLLGERFEINMTKIESRLSKKKAWEYYFFVDILGHCEDALVKKALAELAKHTMFVKILGSYPNVNG